MTEIYFFDSWGGLWMVCPFDHPRAEAFGPSGAACRKDLESIGVEPVANITPWRQMSDAGRVETINGWDFLTTAPSIGQRLRQSTSTAPLCSRRGWYPRPCTGNHLPIAHQLRDDGYAVDLCEAQSLYDSTYDGLLRGSGMPTVSDWAVLCEIRRSREPVDDDDDDE